MTNVKIICDSGSDMPPRLAEELGVTVLPLCVVDESGAEYRDNEVDLVDFYRRMRAGHVFKTSQAPLDDFLEVFSEAIANDQPAVYVGFSSGISGTYAASKLAVEILLEKHPQAKIAGIDTLAASMGAALVVWHTALAAKAGAGFEEVIETARHWSGIVEHIFTVDDVKYLARGGRVSKTSAFFASTLDVKPILTVAGGMLEPVKKVRGEKRLISSIVEMMKERASVDIAEQTVFISHADAPDKLRMLQDAISEELGVKSFITGYIGSVIGAHSGPGTMALFFPGKTRH